MKINIQSVNFTIKQTVYSNIEKKMEKLHHLFHQVIGADVTLTYNSRLDKNCYIRLVVPGDDLIATTQSSTFEAAIAQAVEALERQIEKRKTKTEWKAVPVVVQDDRIR